MNFYDWLEANQCKSSHWTLWCQNICFVTSKFFGKCTNVKLVYWIIPAISKTVYKLASKFGHHPWLNPFIYPLVILGCIHSYILCTLIYAWTQNLDGQTDGRDSFIPTVFVCGSIITGEHLQYVYKHCAKFE